MKHTKVSAGVNIRKFDPSTCVIWLFQEKEGVNMITVRISELRKQSAELQSIRKVAKVYYNNEISYEKLRTIMIQFNIPRSGRDKFEVVNDEDETKEERRD